MENLTLSLGRLHPLVVHLPIGILFLLALFEVAARWPRFPRLSEAQRSVILGCGAGSATVAAALGWLLAESDGFAGTLFDRHQLLGFLTVGGMTALFVVQICRWRRAYAPVFATTLLALVGAGHYGGAMVHGEDYLAGLLPASLQRLIGAPEKKAGGGAPSDPAQALVFADVIHPILEQRCVSCHGEAKSNGDLRMDSWEGLLLGGKQGTLFRPGDIAGSRLVQRLLLPLDHKERMPPKNKPQLSDDELALIEWWVGSGAPHTQTVAQVSPPPDVAEILADRLGAAADAAPLPDRAAVLAQANALATRLGIELRPLTPDGPWLAATARLQGKHFGDAHLAELAAVGPALHWLDLGETGVTDAGMVHLASMRELRRLQLDRTAVTDGALSALAPLTKLESLNLFGTDITDTGLGALRDLPRLRRLHLWQTKVTAEAADRLAKEATDERRIRRWQEEIAARERMIRSERFAVTTGETFPEVRVIYPPPVEKEATPGAP